MFEEFGMGEMLTVIAVILICIIFLTFIRKPKIVTKILYIEKFPEVILTKYKETGDSLEGKLHGDRAKFIKDASPAIAHDGRKIVRLFLTQKGIFKTIKFPTDNTKTELDEFQIGVYASKTFFQAIFSQLKEMKQRLLDLLVGGIAGAGIFAIALKLLKM